MSITPDQLTLMGAPGSPYTRKMLALMRYRQIPYRLIWGSHQMPPPGLPVPRVKLLPTLYVTAPDGGVEAHVDSTPMSQWLDDQHSGRSAYPGDPALRFIALLLEDYADEWLTKAMFHYRWAHKRDADNAAPLLIYWTDPAMPREAAHAMATQFAERQISRLHVVGSNATTGATIEAAFERLVDILDALIARAGFVLGARPSVADFALFGQLSQLGIIEPTSAEIVSARSLRLRAWLDRMEDLSGLEPGDGDWFDDSAMAAALPPLLGEIGRTYAPFLIANARAIQAGCDRFEAQIDGRPWTQNVFPYQAKCLLTLREAHAALDAKDRARVDGWLADTGCDTLFEDAAS